MDNELLIALHNGATVQPVPREAGTDRLGYEEFSLRALARFAMWNDSDWARNGIAHKITGGELGWDALRAELIDGSTSPAPASLPMLEPTQDDLFTIWDALGTASDPLAETAIARRLVRRVIAGEEIVDDRLTRLITGLLVLGHDAEARSMISSLPQGTWASAVAAIELAHPRFGGDPSMMLRLLNDLYRGAGLAPLTTDGEGNTPFASLSSRVVGTETGPLVTIVMSAWRPGEEIITAVRSIVEQSYQNWELIVTDDASESEYDPVLQRVSNLDPRVRVIRNQYNSGTYVRRNEVLRVAEGEFITFQDSDDWAHPQRLEVQVRDLVENPERIANIVRHARVTETLSFATNRGMSLGPAEPTIMFRRAVALDAIGFYDSIRKGADREYRLRLETVTGAMVETVGPQAPLQLMLASSTSLSGSDFAPGWMTPSRVAYRTATDRYHSLIRRGQAEARQEFPQTRRTIAAPPDFLAPTAGTVEVDVLVVADGRARRGRASFLEQVAAEIRAAVDAGLTVGLHHRDTPDGRPGGPRLVDELQALVDGGLIRQVFDDLPVRAGVVIVRHASAVQGHRQERGAIETNKCVIVEDPMAGDSAMRTFSPRDVVETLESWFGTTPGWISAEAFAFLMQVQGRSKRGMVVLSASGAPSSRVKYEDQVVAFPHHNTLVKFQRIGGAAAGADVVHGMGSMDSFLSLHAGSKPQDRLDRTRRFVDELATEGAGLVRTLFGAVPPSRHPLEAEASALLDEATSRFVIVDSVTETPDPARTVTIPFANPAELFHGYPTRERVSGRILCLARESLDIVALGALRTFFLVRGTALSLRVAGVGDASVGAELERAEARSPGSVSGRIEQLSDAALVEELTAAELVLLPELQSLGDYQLLMMALAFNRPVLVPTGEAAIALQTEVGAEWVIPFDGHVTAERLDLAMAQSRRVSAEAAPVLAGREWALIAERYAEVFREVVAEAREAAALGKSRRHAHANNALGSETMKS